MDGTILDATTTTKDPALRGAVPGDHLLLFVRGAAAAAQVFAGRGQEVETVVLERLVYERKQHLQQQRCSSSLAFHSVYTHSGNLDACVHFQYLPESQFLFSQRDSQTVIHCHYTVVKSSVHIGHKYWTD